MRVSILLIALAAVNFIAPLSTAQDYGMVNCCIKPCSCLPERSRKYECSQMTSEECKRLGGESVSNCITCQ